MKFKAIIDESEVEEYLMSQFEARHTIQLDKMSIKNGQLILDFEVI